MFRFNPREGLDHAIEDGFVLSCMYSDYICLTGSLKLTEYNACNSLKIVKTRFRC